MQKLIAGLLTWSRVNAQAGEMLPLDAGGSFRAALSNLQLAIEEAGATIGAEPLPVVLADEVQLIQLFQNLLSNSLKFRSEAPPQVRVSARPDGGVWQFTVRDNGIGVDPAHFGRLFRIFQRLNAPAKYPGTGIGLAVCKRIVERHGGSIWVESEPGRGSAFHFTLPHAGGAVHNSPGGGAHASDGGTSHE
jgi:light-regulated signal transduction histidine kinase (bacteriophytochrome)